VQLGAGAFLQFLEGEPRHHIGDDETFRGHVDDREVGVDPHDASFRRQRVGAAAQQALLAAVRGEDGQVRALTDELSLWAAARGAGLVTAFTRHARGLAAIGRGDFEEAYHHAAAISPPGVLAEGAPQALWSCMDLVEAAMRTGRHAGAAAHVAALRAAGVSAQSAHLDLLVRCSAAMATADHATAIDRFAETLAIPGIEHRPFDLARFTFEMEDLLEEVQAVVSRVYGIHQ